MTTFNLEKYNQERKAFFGQYPYFFANFEDPNYPLEYALFDTHEISMKQAVELSYATEMLWKIHKKATVMILDLTDEQLELMGFRSEILPYIRLNYLQNPSILGRFDFICTDNGQIKMIELNADTPFMLSETFEMNYLVCEHFGKTDMNDFDELSIAVNTAIEHAAKYLGKPLSDVHLVTTSKEIDVDFEEFANVYLLQEAIDMPVRASFEPIQNLIIYAEDKGDIKRGLYTNNMERIDILYRPAHPLEFILDDVSADGERIGLQLLDLVKDKELAIINSPAAYILQSKMLMWMIWIGKDNDELFTEEEQQVINKYMLPTYMDANYFTENNIPYVKKPIYGREGNSVEIVVDAAGNNDKAKEQHYLDNYFLYQQYVEMPDKQIVLKDGFYTKKLLMGSFISNNKAIGLTARIGSKITEWDSHWMAVSIEV
ncbi:glutathionylspermidine synthase family protein [Lysinibacillus sp. UGB7]|uniref:glutathionylspermidine synthase family protein n=1 Tax=Lysinibacillus sp. UGB7 TaxID=3411039 RepID=UPI003B7820A2